MNKIGNWWLKSFEAQAGEQVEYSIIANRVQSVWQAVGGILYVTNQRLLFCPHLFDYFLSGEPLGVNLSAIVQIDKRPKDWDIWGGGLRERLSVTLKSGKIELFVINDLDKNIVRLRDAAARSAGS